MIGTMMLFVGFWFAFGGSFGIQGRVFNSAAFDDTHTYGSNLCLSHIV